MRQASAPVMQLLAGFSPLLAVLVSLFVVYPMWGEYQRLQADIKHHGQELQALKAAPPLAPADAAAVGDEVPSEPPRFLGELTRMAAASGCKLVGYEAGGTEGEKKPVNSMRPVRAKVSLKGYYDNVRTFLERLARSPRLYTVRELALSATGGDPQHPSTGLLDINLTVERYVGAPLGLPQRR